MELLYKRFRASLVCLGLTLHAFADELAPPPINFTDEIVHTNQGDYRVTYDGKHMKMEKIRKEHPLLYDTNVLILKNQRFRRRGQEDPNLASMDKKTMDRPSKAALIIGFGLFFAGSYFALTGDFGNALKFYLMSAAFPVVYHFLVDKRN